ncbi:MAG: type III pantothenate kinase [Mycoplasmataceae bacterium]|nr:type III pantothenate kinase [Mycoplasmataceae bacterium]
MKKKNNLYISIGNTTTTFAYFENSINKINTIKFNTTKFFKTLNFVEILNKFDISIDRIFVSSVKKSLNKFIISYFENNKIIFLKWNNQKNISLDLLDNPKEVGNDIIASAIFANTLGDNMTIISLGTATVIANIYKGKLTGCTISPGLETSYDSLFKKISINKISLKEIANYNLKKIGLNTKESIAIGVIQGHKLMVQEIANSFDNQQNTNYVYYGGNSHYIKFENWNKYNDMDLLGLYIYSKSK